MNNEDNKEETKLDLFYSTKDKRLFWVVGYTDNTCNVKSHIGMLQRNTERFANMCCIENQEMIDNINTDFISNSRRYKSMRYFWLDNFNEIAVPNNAFKLSSDWTMIKWLES